MRRGNHEVAHRLETRGAGTDHVVRDDGFRRAVVPAEHGVAGILQVACRALLVVVARAARPNRALVQADDILRDATVNDAAHVAVADGEGVREFARRIAVVPERERVICRGKGERRGTRQSTKHYTKRFHAFSR